MSSSFFTTPKSLKKRKREDATGPSNSKRKKASASRSRRDKAGKDDSEVSESDDDLEDPQADGHESSSEDETAAERRLRLAEQYLEKIKGETQDSNEIGFDAEDVDRDPIAERLKKDNDETKGRMCKFIASEYDFKAATKTNFRLRHSPMNGVAICPPYVYTVSKDTTITKWELPPPNDPRRKANTSQKPVRRRPVKILEARGDRSKAKNKDYNYHTAPILAVAASSTGTFLATGSLDKKIIVYDTATLNPLRVFTQHRDAVTALSFQPGTNQLYSASRDRTVKVWSMNELAYIETLFGHQDSVVDIAAYPGVERCLSVGARDRTARVWKVIEETQLVFRGGGGSSGNTSNPVSQKSASSKLGSGVEGRKYAEGSIDRVAVIENDVFVTGSDNGSLCLWNSQKKKPVFTQPVTHGLEEPLRPDEASAEVHLGPDFRLPEPQPRWITALATVPLSDLVVTGSWDGCVRIWVVGKEKRTLRPLGILDRTEAISEVIDGNAGERDLGAKAFVNDLKVFERGERGLESLCVIAAFSSEQRLGRWKAGKVSGGVLMWEIPRRKAGRVRRKKASKGEQLKQV